MGWGVFYCEGGSAEPKKKRNIPTAFLCLTTQKQAILLLVIKGSSRHVSEKRSARIRDSLRFQEPQRYHRFPRREISQGVLQWYVVKIKVTSRAAFRYKSTENDWKK